MASRSFGVDLARFAKKAGANADAVVRKVGIDMASRIIVRTPVDTGRARANWNLTLGEPVYASGVAVDKEGSASIARAGLTAAAYRSGQSIWIANGLPYIEALEDGSSGQASSGMVAITVREFAGLVAAAAQGVAR